MIRNYMKYASVHKYGGYSESISGNDGEKQKSVDEGPNHYLIEDFGIRADSAISN